MFCLEAYAPRNGSNILTALSFCIQNWSPEKLAINIELGKIFERNKQNKYVKLSIVPQLKLFGVDYINLSYHHL